MNNVSFLFSVTKLIEQYVTIFEEENPARQLFTGVSQKYQVIEIYGNSRLTNKVRLTYEAMLVNDRLETVILSGTLSPQFRPPPAPKPNCPEPFQVCNILFFV